MEAIVRLLNGSAETTWFWIVRIVGLGIVLWQLLFDQVDRPYMLLLAGGMMGLKNIRDISSALAERKKE